MKSRNRSSCPGQALLEFTLAAVPMIFLLISVEEMARGMWIYVTLAHAIKEGTRYSTVHGADCAQASPDCQITVGAVAAHIKTAGLGLDPGQMNVVLQTAGTTQNCAPLNACLSNGTTWPPSPDNAVGFQITMSGTYPFNTAMVMFIPQVGAARIGSMLFGATSAEEIRY